MSDYFAFRFQEPKQHRKSLVIFCQAGYEVSSLTKTIKEDINENLVPYRLILMGHNFSKQDMQELKGENFFVDEINSWTASVEEKVTFLTVSNDGVITDLGTDEEICYTSALLSEGANCIFTRRKGVITSLPSYHFLKPSGDHCDKFIRASNLFTSGTEVAFLAIGLLPYLRANLRRIYVDTSSISFLVSVAVQLSNKFIDRQPLIESFESYNIFNKSYDFHEDENSLVVISATTSGGLAKDISNRYRFVPANILTLFYSKILSGQQAVFDISSAVGEINSVKAEGCEMCADGSKLIKIEGEQFIPETPKHELLVIKKVDFSQIRQKFFKEFATKSLLQFNISPSENWEPEHFYIEVEPILKQAGEPFQAKLVKKVNKHFARDVETVIYLDDQSSKTLANNIRCIAGNPSVKSVCYKDISEDDLKNSSSVIVVASAITSGRKLLATARKLRGIDKSATITYFVSFSKLPSPDNYEQLRKDLCLGGHELISIESCYLPRFRENSLTPWDMEINILSPYGDVGDPLGEQLDEVPLIFNERLNELENYTINCDLFLPSPSGQSLKLRNTFAFWAGLGLKTEEASQADVYWTIQSILHDLRAKNDQGLATTYHSTLLSPVCFDRFNDGVIQACLLRAAKPTELNYAVDEEFSRQITDIIISIVDNSDNLQGEGALEFLMALWVGRLKVQDKHLLEIVERREQVNSECVRFLLSQIKPSQEFS